MSKSQSKASPVVVKQEEATTGDFSVEDNVIFGATFHVSKTADFFKSVVFKYDDSTWDGALPVKLENQGIELTDEEISESLGDFYHSINPNNRDKWITASEGRWKKDDESETHKVLQALYSGQWECRVHGEAARINPQSAGRIAALKIKGYVIASQRRECKQCDKVTMHDLLVMIPFFDSRFSHGNQLRKTMSEKLKKRIKKIFKNVDACTNRTVSSKELIIDHKFPSQRWNQPESDNPDNMSEADIRKKFQVISNKNNLWKSRYCDTCVADAVRGDFMGINWFYKGDEKWRAAPNDEKGCIGCPWYDFAEWKNQLMTSLASAKANV